MSKDEKISLLLILLLFVVQPALFAIVSRKAYRRSGTLWGLLVLTINIGIVAFFESQLRSLSIAEGVDEVATTMIISSMFILTMLELLQNGRQPTTGKELFRRGALRVWACISGGWIILCALEMINLRGNCNIASCDFFIRTFFKESSNYYNVIPSYFDVGKAFIGVPVLAFSIGLATCWVVDGFRRPRAD
jgi:hypothetical protein